MPINPANRGTYCDKDKQHGKDWTTTVLSRLLAAVKDSFYPKLASLCHVTAPSLILGIPQSNNMHFTPCMLMLHIYSLKKLPGYLQLGFPLQLICHHICFFNTSFYMLCRCHSGDQLISLTEESRSRANTCLTYCCFTFNYRMMRTKTALK